ncbi:subtilase family protein [Luteibacter rhizovicinus]|uniref:Subtilase family protein n=1 Tax=Luteibacter rhizovicinus TaxID=242606 RepID=A0A4R3YXB6_9GAMM|nr:S8 family serine peptidase [Luteibacter rhizovicinus]TCV97827.1 subtilase family protein [Luteibacter rhizovicinus]
MTRRFLTLAACLIALAACTPTRPDDRIAMAHPAGNRVASMDSQRDIVLAVSNPLEPAATHAGSSVLGYTPTGHYGAGQRAVTVLADLKQHYGLHEVVGWPIKALDLYCVVVKPAPGVDRDELIATLAKDERVQLAQPLQDYAVYTEEKTPAAHHYNDPYADLQRGFVATSAALAHNVSQGDGVHIAIVDTGADLTHPDLQARIHDTHDIVDVDTAAFNRDAHGTEIAGVIAAVGDNHQGMVGIAPKATLSLYKACWYPADGHGAARCNSFTLAKALAAVNDTDARIVNLSLGGPADPLLGKLLTHLLNQGRIVVAALPPDGNVRGFPDSAAGVIVVRSGAATTAPPGVLSAPGNDILTTQPGGSYDFTSGSSLAAAHVSGILALMLSLAPDMDAQTARDLLLRSSKVSDGVLEVNAASALDALIRERKAAHRPG